MVSLQQSLIFQQQHSPPYPLCIFVPPSRVSYRRTRRPSISCRSSTATLTPTTITGVDEDIKETHRDAIRLGNSRSPQDLKLGSLVSVA